jgi:hypothetical protein
MPKVVYVLYNYCCQRLVRRKINTNVQGKKKKVNTRHETFYMRPEEILLPIIK